MGLVTLWKNYLAWTQAVVVGPLIAGANRRWKEVAWFLLLASSTMVLIAQSYDLVMNHLSYHKSTNIRLFFETEAPFPAITFCNLNPFKKSMVEHSQELTNLLAAYTYVNKVKQARMAKGTTATAMTTSTGWKESHRRRKRQKDAGTQDEKCERTTYSFIDSSSGNYSLWNCSDGGEFPSFEECDVNNLLSTNATWKSDLEGLLNKCVMFTNFQFRKICTDGSCGIDTARGDTLNPEFEHCDSQPQSGNSHSYNYTYSCKWDNYHLKCVEKIQCFSEPTTTVAQNQSTTPEMTTAPTLSTFETTTAPLTSATELPTTTTGVLTITTVTETTATEPSSTPSVSFTSTMETATATTATTTDVTSATSSDTSRTTASKATSTTTSATTATSALTSASGMASTATPFATTSKTLETSTTFEWTTTKPSSNVNVTTTSVKTAPIRSTSSSTSPTTGPGTTITTLHTTSATVGELPTASSAFQPDTTSSSAPLETTTPNPSSAEEISETSEKTTVHRTTPSSTTLTTTLGTTPTTLHTASATVDELATASSTFLSSAKTSATSQATTTMNPSSTENTPTSSEKIKSVPTNAPEMATAAPRTASTASSETPTEYTTISEAQTASSSALLPPTASSSAVSSTGAMSTILKTTSTEPAPPNVPEKSTRSIEEDRSTTTTGTDRTLTTTRSFTTRSPIATSPDEASTFSTTLATSTPLTAFTTVTASAASSRIYLISTNSGSTVSSASFAETNRAPRDSTIASSSVRTTAGSMTTASAEGVISSTASQSSTTSAKYITSISSLSSTPTSESSVESSRNSDTAGSTSTTAASHFKSTVTTAGGTDSSARTTEKAVHGSKRTSASSSLTQSSSSTAMRGSVSILTSASTDGSDRSSHSSNAPSVVTDNGSTKRGNGFHRSTTLTLLETTTTKGTGEGLQSTTRTGLDSASYTGDVKNRAASASATSGTQRGSTEVSTTLSETSGSYSAMSKAELTDTATGLTVPPTVANETSQSKASTPPSDLPTETMLGGHGGKTTPATTEVGHDGQSSTTESSPNPDNWPSTTRSSTDAEKRVTTDSGEDVPGTENKKESSRTPATPDGSVDRTTSNEEGDGSSASHTTRNQDGRDSELTTTSYEDYLKNIKLNLSLGFDLAELTEEQTRNFEDLSSAYGLDPSHSQVLVDAHMKQALQIIAAKMSPESRQILGFRLKDLVSSCIMNGDPCEMMNDFKQTFDVDYGNCYTFNYDASVKYITKRAGASFGLRMTIISNSTEALPSSSEEGVKIVVHSQDIAPFPNVEGYKSAVGQSASLQLTRSKFSKLGAPYGNCSTLESIAKDQQPFYYNGSYSTEGCFRSCFQRNIATACGCADSRFPSPTDTNVPFCDPLEPSKYKCMEAYIEDNGDYFSVNNCKCYDPCEDTTYKSQVSEAPWPAGSFFYGGYCPTANKLNTDCAEFYSNNGMRLEVSFAQLGYDMIEEEPLSTVWSLFNELVGNSGLWIGFTMHSLVEIFLIAGQIFLWVCGCPYELPEVPSARRRNYRVQVDSGSDTDDSLDGDAVPGPSVSVHEPYNAYKNACAKPSANSMSYLEPPKNFPNILEETALTRREVQAQVSTTLELYGADQAFEWVVPVLGLAVQSVDHAGNFMDV